MAKLSALKVKALGPGRHSDDQCPGLMLHVRDSGSRQWVLRIIAPRDGEERKVRRDLGLGSAREIGLAEARERARQWRVWVKAGRDPVAAQRALDRELAQRERRDRRTFADVAQVTFDALSPAWRNGKHVGQWLTTLRTYAFPKLGELPIEQVDAPVIIEALAPIWLSKPETARRVRQRIGAVLDYAHAQGWRSTPAPIKAVAAGKALPRQLAKKGHHAAVPYADAPQVLAQLREGFPTAGRLALEFAILTAARSGEVVHASWGEIDLDKALWTVPAKRMKAGREHIVPLSPAALDVLRKAEVLRRDARSTALIFPAPRGSAMSDATMRKALRTVAPDATTHGWRSTFRDWVAEQTGFDGETAEMALAHTIKSKTEKAYRRGDLLLKRRVLMEAWSDYLAANSSTKVIGRIQGATVWESA